MEVRVLERENECMGGMKEDEFEGDFVENGGLWMEFVRFLKRD